MHNNRCAVIPFLPNNFLSSTPPPFSGSSDEVSVEQESEDDINSSRSSLDKQAHHRANTTIHVCWHRNTSVSMSDHSLAVEVLLLCPRYPLPRMHARLINRLKKAFVTAATATTVEWWSLEDTCLHSGLKPVFSASLTPPCCFPWVLIFGFFFFFTFGILVPPSPPSHACAACDANMSRLEFGRLKQNPVSPPSCARLTLF